MTGLLSASQMGALSKLVKRGMDTDVRIYDHVVTETDNGSAESWVARSEWVKGWMYVTTTPVMTVGSGLQALVNTQRLYLELGTDIETGDRVEVGGAMFTVEDTTKENTIQAMLTVSMKRVGV